MISCYYVLFTPMRPHGISRTKKKSNDFTLLFTSWILISYQKNKMVHLFSLLNQSSK
nr:MAG TPA: hypothetical protein [Caudoviricetes sp.]